MGKELLITGAAGFAGSHQVDKAIGDGKPVVAQVRASSNLENLQDSLNSENLTLARLDLTDKQHVQQLIETHKPRIVIHLAAQSNVDHSIANPQETIANNFNSTLNLLEAVRKHSPGAIVILTGSSHEYGPNHANPLKEGMSLNPQNPYAVSKVLESLLMAIYQGGGIKVIKARIFNHCGPRRADNFSDGELVRAAVEAKKLGKKWLVEVGSKEYARDWQHVENWNSANLVLAKSGEVGQTYNVCSGKPRSIAELIEAITSTLGLQVEIVENSQLLRPSDVLKVWGDNTKLKRLGWKPGKNFEQMVEETIAWWLNKET